MASNDPLSPEAASRLPVEPHASNPVQGRSPESEPAAASPPANSRLKQWLLYSLIASVLLGAGLGIVVVLRDTWGWFESRVILTTITIAIASILGLTCDFAKTPRGRNLLPYAGLALTLVTTLLILLGIWGDIEAVGYWKTTGVLGVFAAATVHTCLLSIARLAARFRWVSWVSWQLVYGLAGVIAFAIVAEVENQRMFQVIAVLSILVAAVTLLVPLLHRLSLDSRRRFDQGLPLEQRNLAAVDEEIERLNRRLETLQRLRNELLRPSE